MIAWKCAVDNPDAGRVAPAPSIKGWRYVILAGRVAPAPPMRGTLPVPLRPLRYLMPSQLDCFLLMLRRLGYVPRRCNVAIDGIQATDACLLQRRHDDPVLKCVSTSFSGGPGGDAPPAGSAGSGAASQKRGAAACPDSEGVGGSARPQKCSTQIASTAYPAFGISPRDDV
jgi:hypothetical protein